MGKPDYSKVCWFCGKETMEDKGRYFQCTECHATWNKVPIIGPAILTTEKNHATAGIDYKPIIRRKTDGKANSSKK